MTKMNAHVRIDSPSTRALEAVCPAEEIGQKIQQLEEQLKKADQARGEAGDCTSVKAVLDRRYAQLWAYSNFLGTELEWTLAGSARGVFVQVQQLLSLFEDLKDFPSDESGGRSALESRISRLIFVMGTALIGMASIGPDELGRDQRWIHRSEVAPVLEIQRGSAD